MRCPGPVDSFLFVEARLISSQDFKIKPTIKGLFSLELFDNLQ